MINWGEICICMAQMFTGFAGSWKLPNKKN
jgi:hypothetical protein